MIMEEHAIEDVALVGISGSGHPNLVGRGGRDARIIHHGIAADTLPGHPIIAPDDAKGVVPTSSGRPYPRR
jgi:hypothetical protein